MKDFVHQSNCAMAFREVSGKAILSFLDVSSTVSSLERVASAESMVNLGETVMVTVWAMNLSTVETLVEKRKRAMWEFQKNTAHLP